MSNRHTKKYKKISFQISGDEQKFRSLHSSIVENLQEGKDVSRQILTKYFFLIRPDIEIAKEELEILWGKMAELNERFANRYYNFNGKSERFTQRRTKEKVKFSSDLNGLFRDVIIKTEIRQHENRIKNKKEFIFFVYGILTKYVRQADRLRFMTLYKRRAITAFICIQYDFLPLRFKSLSNEELFQKVRHTFKKRKP
jgi:hypothetical protein